MIVAAMLWNLFVFLEPHHRPALKITYKIHGLVARARLKVRPGCDCDN